VKSSSLTIWGHVSDAHPQGWGCWSDTYFDLVFLGTLMAFAMSGVVWMMMIAICGFFSPVCLS